MSPHKQKITILIYCEGAHDLTFVRHLITLYNQGKMTNTSISAKQGNGGSTDGLVTSAINRPGSYDHRYVKADKDRGDSEITRAEELATENNIRIAWSTPCLEAMLLAILEVKDYSSESSSVCKRRFEHSFIPSEKRSDRSAYSSLFTLEVLEEARTRLPELDVLLNMISL